MKSCRVFRSDKKAETYLYLAESLDFEDLWSLFKLPSKIRTYDHQIKSPQGLSLFINVLPGRPMC